jgi:hypothetical protein
VLESAFFTNFIIIIILLAGISVGIEADDYVANKNPESKILEGLNAFILSVSRSLGTAV